jgi:hypothetical protein
MSFIDEQARPRKQASRQADPRGAGDALDMDGKTGGMKSKKPAVAAAGFFWTSELAP